MQSKLAIFTDGSALGNPGPGGRAAVFVASKKVKHISGGMAHTTNNVMELHAVLAAMRALLGKDPHVPLMPVGLFGGEELISYTKPVVIYTDSQYVQKGVTERLSAWQERDWKLKGRGRLIQHVELRQEMAYLLPHFNALRRERVQAHVGNVYNELADTLAKKESYQFAQ